MKASLTPAQVDRADELVAAAVEGRDEVKLGDVARAVSNADLAARADPNAAMLGDHITPGLMSSFLRLQGFAKVGMTGIGHDREPLYRRKG